MVSPGAGANNVASHQTNLTDSELLPTLNADNTCSSFTLLIAFDDGADIIPE
ncbi:MAG: hypothetical protein WCI00_09275 [bacterium]